jgi:ankyrin repeat protein
MNEKLVRLLEGHTERYPHALESKFSRVLEKIVDMWGKPQLEAYFADLLLTEPGKVREGFPPEVASEIFSLSQAYAKWLEKTRHGAPAKPANVWESIPADKRHEFEALGIEFSPRGFSKAIEAGDEKAVALYLSCGVDADTPDTHNRTALMSCALNGNEALARALIRHGARVRVKDHHGYTPLHWAAYRGHERLVGLLIEQGAEVNAASHTGWTPLLQAAARGHLIAAARLLAAGAFPNQANIEGWTPLHKAAANGHSGVVQLLLAKGANPSIRHPNGSTAMSLARHHRHRGTAELIKNIALNTARPAHALHA